MALKPLGIMGENLKMALYNSKEGLFKIILFLKPFRHLQAREARISFRRITTSKMYMKGSQLGQSEQ